jgi:signal transduction histidine kinase
MTEKLEPDRLRTLIDVGGFILSELDPDAVLERVLETACEITGARYAALGVLDDRRRELERFITRGIGEETKLAIGDLPRGRGILGVLIRDPRPLRLSRLGDHPGSYGFPHGHPEMGSFLGVPILIRGEVWGNLYLTEKRDGAFQQADEDAVVVLARWAGIAIENARLHQAAEERRGELERAVRRLQATQTIALAVGTETELDRVLELIVKRGRALVEARSVVILLREGDALVLAASAGHAEPARGQRLRLESASGGVLGHGRPERITDIALQLRIAPEQLGVGEVKSALLVPLSHRSQPLGVLIAFDPDNTASAFTTEDEQTLKAFAASAATAVATAQTVQQQRLRDALAAAESERRRWAQELHDETLQALGGLRVLLASARRRADEPEVLARANNQAIEQIEQEITNLRAIITELRPAALDELGLGPALEALLERYAAAGDLEIDGHVVLPGDGHREVLGAELASTVYRVVQEALTNVVKHAHAQRVRVGVYVENDELIVEVADDGVGFSREGVRSGFGLTGMHERAALAGGALRLDSSREGTTLLARFPLRERSKASAA